MPLLRMVVGEVNPLELGDGLKLPDYPSVGGGRHEDQVVHHRVLAVNCLAPIEDLQVIFGGIVELNHIAFRSIKDRFKQVCGSG